MKPTGTAKKQRSLLPQFSVMGHRILIRIDGDVPLKNNTILDDTRLQAVLPTLNWIKEHGGKSVIVTHMGRPNPKNPNPNLSTNILMPWFERHGFTVAFAHNLEEAQKKSHALKEDILLIENLRFFAGEKDRDKQFAKDIAALGDFYVNEAFGVSHRDDSSITLVPKEFAPEFRTMGLQFEQELKTLSTIKKNPQKPVVLIIGGGKVHDKLTYLLDLLPLADSVLLCPAVVFTLLAAQEKPIGNSLVVHDAIKLAHKILQQTQKNKVIPAQNNPSIHSPSHKATENTQGERFISTFQNDTLVYPSDYQVALETVEGPLENVRADQLTLNMIGIAIGLQTIKKYTEEINRAGTVIFSGSMGFAQRPETMHATYQLLTAMGNSNAFTLVGGGDSVAAAHASGAVSSINLLSTGGGAMLAFLSGRGLPGLKILA